VAALINAEALETSMKGDKTAKLAIFFEFLELSESPDRF
jgi:hypothetical protein